MKDANKWDNIESFLLKECYTLAAQYEENGAARDILRARGKKISIPDGYIPDGSNITLPTIAALKDDYNALLATIRNAGLMESAPSN